MCGSDVGLEPREPEAGDAPRSCSVLVERIGVLGVGVDGVLASREALAQRLEGADLYPAGALYAVQCVPRYRNLRFLVVGVGGDCALPRPDLQRQPC